MAMKVINFTISALQMTLPCPFMIAGARVGMLGVGPGVGAAVIPGASVVGGAAVIPGLRVVVGFRLGAWVMDGEGVWMSGHTGTRQHGSFGSVVKVQPDGRLG